MSLGFTAKQFQERFNVAATTRSFEYRINGVDIKPSTEIADQWQYAFSNRIGFLATVNRSDRTVRSFTYMASGDGSLKSGADIMLVLSLLIRSIDPALTNETANELMLDLMEAVKGESSVERVRNGIRYGSLNMPTVGFIVAINPVQ